MYFILGMIISTILYFVLAITLGGIGSLLFLLLLSGFIWYQHGAIEKLGDRLKNIEELLGIDESKDLNLSDEEIEQELEKFIESEEKKD